MRTYQTSLPKQGESRLKSLEEEVSTLIFEVSNIASTQITSLEKMDNVVDMMKTRSNYIVNSFQEFGKAQTASLDTSL